MIFENPENDYQKTVSTPLSWLWCLLFNWIFFLSKGIYKHAILGFVLAFITFGISWFIYPFFVYGIIRNHYLDKGWKCIQD